MRRPGGHSAVSSAVWLVCCCGGSETAHQLPETQAKGKPDRFHSPNARVEPTYTELMGHTRQCWESCPSYIAAGYCACLLEH
ncbi:hypothetical protein F5883DRAFT_547181 [Diaporthe sp. PMI_573]|nr:hypothetical protein F5883DRAFT_547181 [Diaporthaceae sp. PMI_573]